MTRFTFLRKKKTVNIVQELKKKKKNTYYNIYFKNITIFTLKIKQYLLESLNITKKKSRQIKKKSPLRERKTEEKAKT